MGWLGVSARPPAAAAPCRSLSRRSLAFHQVECSWGRPPEACRGRMANVRLLTDSRPLSLQRPRAAWSPARPAQRLPRTVGGQTSVCGPSSAGRRGWAPSGPGIWTSDFHISCMSHRDPPGSHPPTRRDGRGHGSRKAKAQSRKAEMLTRTHTPRTCVHTDAHIHAHAHTLRAAVCVGQMGRAAEGQP